MRGGFVEFMIAVGAGAGCFRNNFKWDGHTPETPDDARRARNKRKKNKGK